MELHTLYQKVADFEQRLPPEVKALSQCKQGCSKCCYTDLSVFEVEAKNIREHFIKNPIEAHVPNSSACAFLKDEACTIYEARPLICRTQGLGLMFKENQNSFVDICPLNEEILEQSTEKDFLNLDLVNLILSQIERADANQEVRARVPLKTLQANLNQI